MPVPGTMSTTSWCRLVEPPVLVKSKPSARKSVGVELVCSSVTSNNLKDITGDPTGQTSTGVEEAIKANNRHIRYLNFDDHGYSVLDLNRRRAQMDWFVIGDRDDRATGVRWDGSWRTRSGTGRIEPVDRPLGRA